MIDKILTILIYVILTIIRAWICVLMFYYLVVKLLNITDTVSLVLAAVFWLELGVGEVRGKVLIRHKVKQTNEILSPKLHM